MGRPKRGKPTTRRLTTRQVAVLAAVERCGRPTLPELGRDFPQLNPSEILRVLESLQGRELIASTGTPRWVYLGEPPPHFPIRVAPDEVVRFRATRRSWGR
jgi:hypothetical protein